MKVRARRTPHEEKGRQGRKKRREGIRRLIPRRYAVSCEAREKMEVSLSRYETRRNIRRILKNICDLNGIYAKTIESPDRRAQTGGLIGER